MPATLKLHLSLEDLASAIASLTLDEKRQLQEIIEQQIFEAEEALYSDNPETIAALQAVKAEYATGDYSTMDEYLASRVSQS
jgi:hypothetical protein